MFKISKEVAEAVRKKRALLFLSKQQLSETLEISAVTLRKVEKGEGKINSVTYSKVTEWLVKDM
ncbi:MULTISPECIES: transcriptional regulator [Enterococcus]|uniref:transcriptional regulator n=1 Tax=Enterococcus TaxID=1350 RepID=UPI001AD6FB85|nr:MULTISPECIES: transcriptional regulator [Enterococcus]MBO6359634.1 transcriptional regulator [Enterococcus casseliflavus]MBO6375738.1 transcriptional regulator [Enterococcus casseliflavus]MEB3136844.1 transcriptional regulator [Enterococcus faecium]QZO08884.1 transcriptional regulator [Enterococcus raffinosus]